MALHRNGVRRVTRVLAALTGLTALFLAFPAEAAISLAPLTATNPVGTSHTVTATVLDGNGAPISGITVTFDVISGPNNGVTGTSVTNTSGAAAFTYTSNGTSGTDQIQALYTFGPTFVSNTVTKSWITPIPTLTGSGFALLALLLAAAGLPLVGALHRQ